MWDMFTGVIRARGTLQAIARRKENLAVRIVLPQKWRLREGDSVSINGICSTVTKARSGYASFEYMPETVRKTTARMWRAGDTLNMERSARLGLALDGHLVTGHVDGVATLLEIALDGDSRLFKLQAPEDVMRLVAAKGSVALDGVSLTVVKAAAKWFSVALIPYTLARTNLGSRKAGDRLNVEADILSKYIARSLSYAAKTGKRRNV